MSVSSVGTEKFTDAFLDELRLAGDPPADAATRSFIDDELGADTKGLMNALIARRVGNAESDESSPMLHAFAVDRPPLPTWAQPDMIDQGQGLFAEFVPQLGLGLW